jgi:tetratricopeptide (TPR) repeat protein
VAARLAGKAAGVPAVTMTICQHASGDRRRYQFFQQPAWGQAFLNIQIWPRFRDLPIPAERVQAAMDDVLDRLRAPNAHVYSPQKTFEPGDFRDKLGIPKDKKILALFTSSLDEMIAATSQQDALDLPRIRLTQTFKDQIEWIKAVIAFVGEEQGYHLVVRIHPREGANKREGTRSQHLLMLQEAFDRDYPNCKIIWPETQVSSYDLAEIADLVLVSWSTMGIELSRMGVPILASTYGNAPRPWDDFHEWAPTPREYFRKLREMVGSEPGRDALKHAFRWYILHYFGFTIDFSDVFPAKDFHGVPPYKLPAAAVQVERTILEGEDVVASYERDLRTASGPDAERDETDALLRQARRAVHCLMTREDRAEDFALVFAADQGAAESLSPAEKAAIAEGRMALAIDGTEGLEYRCGAIVSRRHSPMARRLARLGSQKSIGPAGIAPRAETGSWTALVPALPGQETWDEAVHHREAGRLGQARDIAEKAIRAGGETPEWANFLGHLAHLEGDAAKAKLALLEVARRWPRFGKAHNNLAALCWADGEKAQALEHMAAALELEPDQRDIVLNGTRILVAMGMEDEARALGDAYLLARPGDRGLIESALGAARVISRA